MKSLIRPLIPIVVVLMFSGCASIAATSSPDRETLLANLSTLAIDATVSQETALQTSNYLLISPESELSAERLEELQSFTQAGGDVLIVANSAAAELYGVAFEPATSTDWTALTEPPFNSISTWSAVRLLESSSCASFSDFFHGEASLVLHLYCPTGDGELSNLVFVSDELLDLFTQENDDPDFLALQSRLSTALSIPEAIDLPYAPSFSSSFIDLLSQEPEKFWFFTLFSTAPYRPVTLSFLFLGVLLLGMAKFHPERLTVLRHHLAAVLIRVNRFSAFASFITAGFFLSSLFFVYNLFFFHWLTPLWALVTLGLGVLAHVVGVKSTAPPSFPMLRREAFRVGVFALALTPVFLFNSLFDINLGIFPNRPEPSFQITAPDLQNEILALKGSRNNPASAWVLPHPGILLTSPFGVEFKQLPKDGLVQMAVQFEGQGEWNWIHDEASDLLFASFLASFQPFFELEDSGISFYRHEDSDPVETMAESWDWKHFALKNLPHESAVNFVTSEGVVSGFSTPLVHLSSVENQVSTFESQIAWNDFLFYTALPTQSSTLDSRFRFTPQQLPSADLSGSFLVADRLGDTVYEEHFSLEGLATGTPFDLEFHVNDLAPATYSFTLEFLFTGTSQLQLDSLSVNSPYLVFQAGEVNSLGQDTVYFKKTDSTHFAFQSDTGETLEDLGGLSLSDLSIDYDQLHAFSFPSSGELSSTRPTFYSLSEASWFYPYPFYFPADPREADYLIVEHHLPLAEPQTDGTWTWAEAYGFIPSATGPNHELWFDLPRVIPSTPSWILIKDMIFFP